MLRAVAAMRERLGSERGSALVIVIGLGFAFVIMGLTLAVVSSFASSTAGGTRAGIQAQAAADAGIDNTIKQLNSVVMGKESSFRCALSSTYATDHGTSDVVAQIKYHKVGDPEGTYSCNPATQFADNSEITGAEIVSTSTLTIGTGSGEKTVVKSVKQVVDLDMTMPQPPLFSYGFFSNGNVHTTNNFTVNGGGVFTNGNFECNSNAQVFGDVTALGTVTMSNSCLLDSLWAGGKTVCSSGAKISGDLTVSSVARTYFSSGCKVGGNVWTGGDFDTQETTVGKNVLSATGRIEQQSSSRINGWAQAAKSVVGGTVSGARVENSPSDVPPVPVRQDMPAITATDIFGAAAGSPATKAMGAWVKENAVANGAPSWSASMSGTHCAPEAPSYGLNGGLKGPSGTTIIDARDCDVSLLGPMTLTLDGDLTIVAKSFVSTNGLTVTSTNPSKDYKLRIIVPLTPGAASCSGVSTGQITLKAGGFVVPPNVDVFLYTNGTVTLTNDVTLSGSVYGCSTSLSNGTNITYKDMTPPGMETDDDANYNFRPVMRYDVRADG